MTHPKTSVPWGHNPTAPTWNAWEGAGFAALPPANDLYASRVQMGEYQDHFLGGRLPSRAPVNNLLPIVGQPVGPSLLSRTVGPGSKGDEVMQLQQFLNGRIDPSPGIPDNGYFDDQTLAAVKAFQRASGIFPSGKVTSKTWFKLLFGGRVAWPDQPKRTHAPYASSSKHPVAAWSVKDKFDVMLIKCGLQLPGDLRFTFQQTVDFGTRQSLAVIFAAWSGSLLTNGTEGIDFGLRAQQMGHIDVESLDIIEDFNSCLIATSNASQQVHLEHAGTYMARVITRAGVALFLALVHRVATKQDKPGSEMAAASTSSPGGAGKPIDMHVGLGTGSRAAPSPPPPPAPGLIDSIKNTFTQARDKAVAKNEKDESPYELKGKAGGEADRRKYREFGSEQAPKPLAPKLEVKAQIYNKQRRLLYFGDDDANIQVGASKAAVALGYEHDFDDDRDIYGLYGEAQVAGITGQAKGDAANKMFEGGVQAEALSAKVGAMAGYVHGKDFRGVKAEIGAEANLVKVGGSGQINITPKTLYDNSLGRVVGWVKPGWAHLPEWTDHGVFIGAEVEAGIGAAAKGVLKANAQDMSVKVGGLVGAGPMAGFYAIFGIK